MPKNGTAVAERSKRKIMKLKEAGSFGVEFVTKGIKVVNLSDYGVEDDSYSGTTEVQAMNGGTSVKESIQMKDGVLVTSVTVKSGGSSTTTTTTTDTTSGNSTTTTTTTTGDGETTTNTEINE